jgi:hypothetical protein
VTKTGGYAYVSQADDGTMAALAGGERLQKLSRTGRVLAEFPTYVSDGAPKAGPVTQFAGPFNPEISPDGRLIAFEWYNRDYSAAKGCNASTVRRAPSSSRPRAWASRARIASRHTRSTAC